MRAGLQDYRLYWSSSPYDPRSWNDYSLVRPVRAFSQTSEPAPSPSNTSNAYVVGDTGPGGGKIFYVAPTSFSCGPTLSSFCDYLEAAPTTGTAAWVGKCDSWSAHPVVQPVAIGTTGTAIGTGYKNTLAMISQNGAAGYAGTISQAFRGPNGKTDWYLPSNAELYQLYRQKGKVGEDFNTNSYWSSSDEYDWGLAWSLNFYDGYQVLSSKGDTKCVRPVRAFSQTSKPAPTSKPTPSPSNTSNAYVVGDTGPGGGKIFYVTATSFSCGPTLSSFCNYLEAAPTTGAAAWVDARYRWSAPGAAWLIVGAVSIEIGTGYKNTLAMISQNGAAGYAGTISQAFRGPNNFTDWYLPSLYELSQLSEQKGTVGGFVTSLYWSSSEGPGQHQAQLGYFDVGAQSFGPKDYSYYVRPVRAF